MFTGPRLLILSLILWGGLHPVVAGPPERDRWYAYVEGEQRYGYQHVRVTELENGNLQYTTDSRVLVTLFGQQQEITGRGALIVTPAFRPVSLESEWTQLSGSGKGSAVMKGRTLEVTVEHSGVESKSTYAFDEADHVLPAVCLDDFLRHVPEATRSLTVKSISGEGLNVDTLALKRRSAEDSLGWEVTFRDGITTGTIFCDRDGKVQRHLYRAPKFEMRRCTEAEAKQIDYKQYEGRDLLTFPVDKDISAPHRLKHLTIELTWKGHPLRRIRTGRRPARRSWPGPRRTGGFGR